MVYGHPRYNYSSQYRRYRYDYMWVIDEEEQKKIDEVKAARPLCIGYQIVHTFIEYCSEHKKVCHDCGYEEKTIIKE